MYYRKLRLIFTKNSWEVYTPWLNEAKKMLKKINQRIPLENRMTTCEEIGQMVAFLLSEKSSHTTGQLIHVDGGYVHLDRAID